MKQLDFGKFWRSNDGIVLLDELASFSLVIVRACVCLGVAVQRAEIVSTPTRMHHTQLFAFISRAKYEAK